MKDEDIIRLFYNCIIKEATTGRIDSFQYFNLPFQTIIRENDSQLVFRIVDYSPYFDKNFVIPTLFINSIPLFNQLLLEYVHKALEFYDDSNYYEEILNGTYYDEEKMISKEKCIICSLFANMSMEDFSNPYRFLERRIQMFDHPIIGDSLEIDLGYVDVLKGRLIVQEIKEKMCNETPYSLRLRIHSDEYDEDFYFPDIRIGICDDVSVFYAIQNEVKNDNSSPYVKYVNRHVRKVDQGINLKEVEEYDMKDITSSFLVSALVGSLFSQNERIEIVPLLIERWNAKKIANRVRVSRVEKKENFIMERDQEQLLIQPNITDKFMRLFERLEYQIDGFSCYFHDMTQSCKLDDSLQSENELLQEIIRCINEVRIRNKKMV